jgi:hypothetical protein
VPVRVFLDYFKRRLEIPGLPNPLPGRKLDKATTPGDFPLFLVVRRILQRPSLEFGS